MTSSLTPRTSLVLLVLAAVLCAAPLILPIKGEFGGTDDAASKAIEASHPGYVRWTKPFWTPPSPEIESLLFALEAAIGAGILGYALGRRHGSRRRDDADR
ncbi:MAG: energy-coupling factor ABC transporter substrate-binding protein [Phyllobacteriaceae bacterium]|nr:energy-coupling factor ABC transporter substrate-binding protein [Phyllobacteriaceae bacterium]